MDHPSIAQQRGLAYAPLPFAALSLVSSGNVVHHLLFRQRRKLGRMYHRLVLAMNVAILANSANWIWSPFAVPEGTQYHLGASGTVRTCTINVLTVPIYYGSLSLQAFMGMKHGFNEEKYQWIEKYVHIVAWCVPVLIAVLVAATENFNPTGSGCFIANAPLGCDADPDVPCERGGQMPYIELVLGLGLIFLYLIFPPSVIFAMRCWIRKVRGNMGRSEGMQRLRDSARKEAMKNISRQISLYLLSFWFVWVFGLVQNAYLFLTGKVLYGLLILSTCLGAMEGFIYSVVYFALQSLGTPKVRVGRASCASGRSELARSARSELARSARSELTVEDIRTNAENTRSARSELARSELTVEDIRTNAENKTKNGSGGEAEREESYVFNIFDGVADADSPWAKFINEDDSEFEEEEESKGEELIRPEHAR